MTSVQESSPPAEDVPRLAEHLFREEAGRLVSILTGIFGVRNLHLAEDVVQEAMARALKTWPYYGVPDNPRAWLMRTARNLAVDVIRRETRFREKQDEIITHFELRLPETELPGDAWGLEREITDDRLRLMFACCHPVLPVEQQIALALKVLGGFSPREIARAFFCKEAAIAKRLTRARQRLQREDIRWEIPVGSDLPPRLEGVLHSLYLLFNEGYKASGGERIVREELCEEAIRLTRLLAEHPEVGQPRVHALLALMYLNGARLQTRVDDAGNLLRMEDQDRSRWNKTMIQQGVFHLARVCKGDQLSEYHLQAGISACHCLAPDVSSTDWPRILDLYDHLMEINDSPLIALNRAVALAKVRGPDEGIAEVERLLNQSPWESYYLTHAVLGEFECQRKDVKAAAGHFQEALQRSEMASERAFLSKRLQECRSG
ncbi:MAG: sigma-70 family RNA polymerase sigma factor [Verrucomicrobia bacterium]|nr:sigma-70 family RNA polymerase sigma factor [Verrucomicrobiota bacterium]MCH8514180.1 sigma-70 family RNA polymerase sigma factor [Kiritimatiellia bacterium]